MSGRDLRHAIDSHLGGIGIYPKTKMFNTLNKIVQRIEQNINLVSKCGGGGEVAKDGIKPAIPCGNTESRRHGWRVGRYPAPHDEIERMPRWRVNSPLKTANVVGG